MAWRAVIAVTVIIAETVVNFPDPKSADEGGLLCMGGNLEVETLVSAYSQGIFPWPHPGYPLLWFSPLHRGIIEFQDLHIPKSLQKFIRKSPYKITMDTAFRDVITSCANVPRPAQDSTWITQDIIEAYVELHRQGYAHSVEAWQEKKLVGGVYGVWVGGVFVGESMFYKAENASKICLLTLIDFLQSVGHEWMDVQMITPVLKSLGGKYLHRDEFLKKWHKAFAKNKFQSIKKFVLPRGP